MTGKAAASMRKQRNTINSFVVFREESIIGLSLVMSDGWVFVVFREEIIIGLSLVMSDG